MPSADRVSIINLLWVLSLYSQRADSPFSLNLTVYDLSVKSKWISLLVVFSPHISFSFFVTLELLRVHFRKAHLDPPGTTFPISTAGSTQEIRTDFGDMTLTLMSRGSYSGGSGRHPYEKIIKTKIKVSSKLEFFCSVSYLIVYF